ncbi:MAG TPA: hypothetical protein VGJ62_10710 [Gemmatimonadaceae bacterium]
MSDPRGHAQADPHPISQHRTPGEIAADEEGPIGHPDPEVERKRVLPDGALGKDAAKKDKRRDYH